VKERGKRGGGKGIGPVGRSGVSREMDREGERDGERERWRRRAVGEPVRARGRVSVREDEKEGRMAGGRGERVTV
jgi:hypothetical protein